MFGIIDYIIFVATVIVSFSIGIVFAVLERKRNTTVNYFLANRKTNPIPTALSHVVSFLSSILILGFPAEGYAYGVGLAYHPIGIAIAYVFAALLIVPVFYPLKLISVYEYFYLRYGNNVLRYMSLASGIMFTLFYMATVTVGTCVALNVVVGIPAWGTMVICTVVTAAYTSVGGIKAVIWTDVFQFIVMLSGICAILVKANLDVGGSEKVMEYAKERFQATNFSFDPTIRYTFWNVSFGTIAQVLYLSLTQPSMQRIYSVSSVRKGRYLFYVATPMISLTIVMTVIEGVILFAYFSEKGCDILSAGLVDNINAIVPFAILELFQNQPGLAGLFTASLSSAALSTLSSCLSSLSAITYEDIVKVNFPEIKSHQATRFSKIIVLIYGLVAMGLSFAIIHIPGSLSVIFTSFTACMGGPICAAFIVSMFFRRATTKGVATGMVFGCAITLWINLGNYFSDVKPYPYLAPGPVDQCYKYDKNDVPFEFATSSLGNITSFSGENMFQSNTSYVNNTVAFSQSPLYKLYSISYMLYTPVGILTSICVGLLISYCTKPEENVDNRCLFSLRKHVIEELFGSKTWKSDYKQNKEGANDPKEGRLFLKEEEF